MAWGPTRSPDSGHCTWGPSPTRFPKCGRPAEPKTILEVRGRTYYIIVHLVSCVLEKKLTHQICDFTENIA